MDKTNTAIDTQARDLMGPNQGGRLMVNNLGLLMMIVGSEARGVPVFDQFAFDWKNLAGKGLVKLEQYKKPRKGAYWRARATRKGKSVYRRMRELMGTPG